MGVREWVTSISLTTRDLFWKESLAIFFIQSLQKQYEAGQWPASQLLEKISESVRGEVGPGLFSWQDFAETEVEAV
jgi:hypothetical protein